MPMVQLKLHKKNELLCLLIRSSVRHHKYDGRRWSLWLPNSKICVSLSNALKVEKY